MNRFSEFASEEKPFDGDKVKIDDILNKEIVVCDFKQARSKYPESRTGNYTTLSIRLTCTDRNVVVFTGSEVIHDQCVKYKEHMPFVATIKKINKYYTFT